MVDWPLLTGAAPVVLAAAGCVALLSLVIQWHRRWWTRTVPVVVLAAAALVAAGIAAVTVLAMFPDPVPAVVWWAVGAGLVAIGLALAGGGGPVRGVLAVAAVLVVLGSAGNQVNLSFGQFPTLRAVLGLPVNGQADLAAVNRAAAALVTVPPGRSLAQVWQPPAGMPTAGTLAPVRIPAPVSGFAARPGWVYLPPAYLTTPRAQLPVLVLLAGQPGSPRDWLDGGQLVPMMDRFAAAHRGLAPVVVMPDWLGSPLANPLCLDSRLGRNQTYLTVDVPAWVRATLQVQPDPSGWAVAGSSAGGTCALQLALNAPRVYPTFVDISGQSGPTLGDRSRTVSATFGGDTSAFTAVNPLDVLARRRFLDTAGFVVAGSTDASYRPQAEQIAAAARRAGMQIEYRSLPGGHDWHVWGPGLQAALPWLATRLRLGP